MAAGEKIIGYKIEGTPDGPLLYVSVKFDDEGKVSFVGHTGYILSYAELNAIHDEYVERVDMEDEYGYMADEESLTGTDRERFLERMRRDLEQNWPYPEELNNSLGSFNINGVEYYATWASTGQMQDHLNDFTPLIHRADYDFVVSSWKQYHLKPTQDVPPEVIAKMNGLMNSIDNQWQVQKAIAQRGRISSPHARVSHRPTPEIPPFYVTHNKPQARLRLDRREVPVKRHLRRTRK